MTASHRIISGPATAALAGAAWLCLGAGTALAASPQEERWDMLRDMYFSGRTVEDAGPLLSLEAPKRANDAAVVPVRIVTAPGAGIQVTAVHLIVDGNPVPLAATFRFAQGDSPQTIDTRLRVDAYTNITAVAETGDGRLLRTVQFVKASGGCSAPALKNAQLTVARMGKMKLNLPDSIAAGKPMTAQLLISHPNYTGMQYDQLNHYIIPAHYVKRIAIRYNGAPVLDVQSDISLSEDPSIHFSLVPDEQGTLEVIAEDSNGRIFNESWPIRANSGS
ncbi:quinoprotein dehydrogenase-associated SoxYZ-like carrier [Roseomonas genomospecies 6]|uniref:Quinoprotein dehydrogenase-associated SoxYZ-like carrier n=1 Tax=Roseomonas genomospecies 6 TaxID=214106 RepID=A0A9W7KPJ5_9PROT|nr:quinoprotein dehydrogenase-associated SoxYZ-like carrier [Roseomonas genomospecies 6]KAA0676930.1 quinoprotein dehydrogenase-associated SoxYZ-like carrier [Roseomonas genomospecies 6]